MPHYHIFMGAGNAAPMQTATFEDYDESLHKFLKLAKGIYGRDEYWAESLTFQNLLKASDFGNGQAMTIGTPLLVCQWVNCPGRCIAPSWN